MDFNLSEEQQMLRDGAQRFVRERYAFDARRTLAQSEDGFSRAHWRMFGELGWLALGLPEEVGGLACAFTETAILLEEFGRGLVLEPYVTTAVLCARILERCENAAARGELLGALAEGRLRLALAHDEPGVRFDPAHAGLRARPQGDGFVLEGEKILVLDGPAADRYVVSATLAGDAQPSLFVVARDAQALARKSYRLIDGGRAEDLDFKGLVCPAAARIAGPARAAGILAEAFDAATVARMAEAIGAMEAVMALTAEYIKTRVQFGQPIGKFQALQHRMAEMFVEVEKSRSSLYRALAYLDSAAAQRASAVSSAKMVVAAAGRFVGGQGIQLHGGIGLTEEYAVGHFFRKLVAFEKIQGDADWHLRRYIAQRA